MTPKETDMPIDEQQQAIDQLAASGIRIPPQPKILTQLDRLIRSTDFDTRAIVKIISQDPGIVAMLFKAARSPVFSRGRKLETLDQILMVIGVKQTYNIVQAAALASSIGDSKRRAAFDTFWTRAGEVAQLACLIAEDNVSVCNVFPDQAYMAGMFHECGVPVLMMRFPDYCQKLVLDNVNCWPRLAEEDKKFSVDHCSVGYLVARHWGLPDFVCKAIQYHHDLPADESGVAYSLICILQMAIQIYHRLNNQPNAVWDKIGARVVEELGLNADEEEDYCEEVSRRFLKACR